MDAIWPFFEGTYKVHCRNRSHARQIAAWIGCRRHAVCYYPDGHVEEDVVIPAGFVERARILIGRATAPENGENALVVTQ